MKYIIHALTLLAAFTRCLASEGIEYNKEEPFPDPHNPGKTVIAISNLCGLGGVINKVKGKCLIIDIFSGSGAEKAKLQIGDEILSVDGKDISKVNLEAICKQLRGNPDTEVKLTILRKDTATPVDITVKRVPFIVPDGR